MIPSARPSDASAPSVPSSTESSPRIEPAGLARQLGLAAAVALIVGEVIGVGIFLTPAGMARSLGAPMWVFVIWLGMGAAALCGAWTFGELAARYPAAGGIYVYLREAFGLRWAFLYGWMALLVMDPGITAALAVGFTRYAGYAVPLTATGATALAMAAILLLAALNALGVRQSATFVRWLTWLKVGFLACLVLLAFGAGRGDWGHFTPFAARPDGAGSLFGALAGGLVGAFFAYGGWWDLSKVGGEVRDAERTMPRALAWGVGIVTAAYVGTSAAFLYLVPLADAADDEAFVARAGELLFGPAGGQVFAGIVIVSVLGSLAGLLLAAPRVAYAMSRDGVLFHGVGALHPRFGTPARAIALQAALSCAFVAVGTFDQILGFFVPVVVAFLGLTAAGVYVLRRRLGPPPAFRAPGYPVTPAVFLLLSVVLVVLLVGGAPRQALAGAVVVALGVPVYEIVRRRRAG